MAAFHQLQTFGSGPYNWSGFRDVMRAQAVAAALILMSGRAALASPFDGLWVADLKMQMGQAGFDNYVIKNGNYTCESCRPPRNYPADGRMRSIPGDVSVLSEGVSIAGSRTIVTRIVDHEMTRVTRMTVSPNGKTATYVSLDKLATPSCCAPRIWPNALLRLRLERTPHPGRGSAFDMLRFPRSIGPSV